MLTPLAARAVWLAVLATALVAVRPAATPAPRGGAQAPDIRAVLDAHCTSCHVRGGTAPMPLTTADDIRPWAHAIKEQVLTRRMPKWSAAHGYGAFANDPSLTPTEMATVAAWADGGSSPATASRRPAGSPGSTLTRQATAFRVAAAAADVTVRTALRWIGGWDFEPGDPLITSATLTSADGTPIATWTAGDAPVRLATRAGVHVVAPIRIVIQRRTRTGYETPVAAKPSVLRLLPRPATPKRRVWVEQTACGAPRAGRAAVLIAVRPLLADGAAARLWLERPGSPRTIVGWFRDYESRSPRTYWLAHPADLPPESRIAADAACRIELTLASR